MTSAQDTNEKKLRREFEQFGDIKSLRVVHVESLKEVKEAHMSDDGEEDDAKLGKPRGYASVPNLFLNEPAVLSLGVTPIV